MNFPLQIVVYFHPDSPSAPLASKLYRHIAGGADDAGLRIPVRFHSSADGRPREPHFEEADHTLLVVLIDRVMTRRVGPEAAGDRWAETVGCIAERIPTLNGPHAFLPVAVDGTAFTLDEDRFGMTSFVRLDVVPSTDQAERLLFHVASAALQLLQGSRVSAGTSRHAPVQIFLSHAKPDLPRDYAVAADDDPVRALLLELSQGPVEAWYDAKKIPRGGRFDHEIQRGILDSSALIAIVTNQWSSREWCRREVLEAKEARRPVLVVDYITDEKPRLFPYLGNAPVMRWKDRDSARKAVTFAVREALRYQYYMAALEKDRDADVVIFGVKPELLSAAQLPSSARRVVYPDPPLGEEELRELRRVVPHVEFSTPLTRVASRTPSELRSRIALSLSGSPDAVKYGGSTDHLTDLAFDLNLYLMAAGFTIAYGGKLGPDGIAADVNFTDVLFSVARSYSAIARSVGTPTIPVIKNYVAWPIHLQYGEDEYQRYQRLASLERCRRPQDLGLSDAELGISSDVWFPPNTPGRNYAWARSLSSMREQMRDAPDIRARIVVGGKLTGYLGKYPGVVEEALLDLRVKRPTFLIGCMGGAARLVCDALRSLPRPELTTEWVLGTEGGEPRMKHYTELQPIFRSHRIEYLSPEGLADEFRLLGSSGMAAALNNGLSDSENEELIESASPQAIVDLVIRGLSRLIEQSEHLSCADCTKASQL